MPPSAPPSDLSGWTALVADGSPHGRRLSADALARIGIRRVRTARDGAEAVGALSSAPPHLLLLDWDLPVVPAREIAALARTGAGTPPVLVVTLTTPTRAAVEGAVEAGAGVILVCPFSPGTLRERLERARAA